MSSGDGTDPSLDAAREAVAPVREEELRVIARAEVDPVDARDAGVAKRELGRAPQVELPVHRQILVEEPRDLRPDLVAARPDCRPHDRRESLCRVDTKSLDA